MLKALQACETVYSSVAPLAASHASAPQAAATPVAN